MEFNKPSMAQKEQIDRIVRDEDVMVCDQIFGNLYCWGAEVALAGDCFITRWGKRVTAPLGADRKAVLEQLIAEGVTTFLGIDERYKEWMEREFPNRFTFKEKSNFDYVYEREALATLKGKKLAAKRNHINAFEANHQWEVRPIDGQNLPEIMEFNDWWCRQNNCDQEDSLAWEGCAVRKGLKHYEELGFIGLALYADGNLCGFTYGEPLGKEGFCIHAEKADGDLRGAYPMINREFAKSLPEGVRWVNREDDAGDEGLKKAKMSYRPALLLKKYQAELI
jgi:hypothetical protein